MKKIKIKISTRIGLGFAFITLAMIINALFINKDLNKCRVLNAQIHTVYQPSESLLIQMQDLIGTSQVLIKNWVFVDKIADTPDKNKLITLQNTSFNQLKRQLMRLTDQWPADEQLKFSQTIQLISDTLFVLHKQVMEKLNNVSSYNDPETMFNIIPLVSENGMIIRSTHRIIENINILVKHQQGNIVMASAQIDTIILKLKTYIIITCLVLVIISLLGTMITVGAIVRPINYIKRTLLSMSKGVLPHEKIWEKNDEVGEMSKALNELVSGLKGISSFALDIGRGNYNSEFKPLSDDDVLGNSLLRMRDDLKAAAIEDAKRKTEDEQRNWASSGIAKFSDVLRQDNDKLEVLSYNVVSNLVKYLDANQGGIFILNDYEKEIPFIEQIACYAYNYRKNTEKHLEMKEGLLGRCILEKETIYLTDIPENYIKINSGLGDATPRSLLLVPLVMNNDVFGVIEIASFKEFLHYQIEFVEKIAESIASTLSTVKTNMQTQKLLNQSRIQTEELAAQEEEMRQNMEELRATQEQSTRKEEELKIALTEMQKKAGNY